MKSLYSQRFAKIWAGVKSVRDTNDPDIQNEYRKYNRNLLKRSRKGRYLIKMIYSTYKQYICYGWQDDGWISTCENRKDAQWFSKKEVDEFKLKWGDKIQVVRR